MNPVDTELAHYQADALTVRMLNAIYGVVPYSPKFTPYVSVDDALRAIKPGALAPEYAKARELAASSDEVADILWMARLMDTGDKGYAVVTGFFTAFNLFTKGTAALDLDPQQRNDAILKAIGLSYMVYKAYPGTIAGKAAAFRDSPNGQALAVYYAACEVALPFADNAVATSGNFLADWFGKDGATQAARLGQMAGGKDVGAATQMLSAITGQLQKVVDVAKGYVKPVAAAAAPYVPGALATADKVTSVVATAADVMPVYTLLGARLAAEAAARRAVGAS